MSDVPHSENLLPYLKGELPPIESVRLQDALQHSPQLRSELEAMQKTLTWLNQHWPDEAPPSGPGLAWERLRQAAAATQQDKRARPSLPDLIQELGPRSRRRRVGVGLAVAASLMLALWINIQGPTPVPPPAVPRATITASQGEVWIRDEWLGARRIDRIDRTAEPSLFGNQRVETKGNGRVTLKLTDESRLVLEPDSVVTILAPNTPDESHAVRLERGRVAFDVTPRDIEVLPGTTRPENRTNGPNGSNGPDANGSIGAGERAIEAGDEAVRRPRGEVGSPDSEPVRTSIPFVVKTAHGELQVRGTKFVVDVTSDVTLVVVMEGRVDAYSPLIPPAERKMEKVVPGMFAALGTSVALAAVLPDGPDLHPPRPNTPDGDNPLGAPPSDPNVTRVVSRSLIDVSLAVTHRDIDPRTDEARATITLHNASPFTLRLDHPMNHDNIKLNCQSPRSPTQVWAPVRPVRTTLEPNESKSYEVLLKPVLYGQPYGAYYLTAVFDGRLGLEGLVPSEFSAEVWRNFGGRSVSVASSVLYAERDDKKK